MSILRRVFPVVVMMLAGVAWAAPKLETFLPAPWDFSKVTHRIWVAPGGKGDGSSAERPLGSIQSAVTAARPGTAILVRAGVYEENVDISVQAKAANGTERAPILLVSADGLEAATIRSTENACTVNGYRRENWAVIGFHIIGAGSQEAGDNSPIKIGSAVRGKQKAGGNWLVAGNRFSGVGRDGSKAYQIRNVTWLGNTYDGDWGEECCDNVVVGVTDVATDTNRFCYNSVGGTALYTAVTMKYGTNHYEVSHNDFTVRTGDGKHPGMTVRIGGNGGLGRFLKYIPWQEEPDFDPQTASHVRVAGNRFAAEAAVSVQFYGSRDSVVEANDFTSPKGGRAVQAKAADLGKAADGRELRWVPQRDRITGNRIAAGGDDTLREGILAGEDFVIEGNSAQADCDPVVGAAVVRPVLEELIRKLAAGAR